MALPSATHKDTSCCSDKAVPVFPLGHNCSALTCSHKGSTVRRVRPPLKSTPAELWLNMWQVARGTCVLMCLHTCMFFFWVFFPKTWLLYSDVKKRRWGGWLSFGVCAAAFELLGVVWGHVWKVSEDVVVGVVTWRQSRDGRHELFSREPQLFKSTNVISPGFKCETAAFKSSKASSFFGGHVEFLISRHSPAISWARLKIVALKREACNRTNETHMHMHFTS